MDNGLLSNWLHCTVVSCISVTKMCPHLVLKTVKGFLVLWQMFVLCFITVYLIWSVSHLAGRAREPLWAFTLKPVQECVTAPAVLTRTAPTAVPLDLTVLSRKSGLARALVAPGHLLKNKTTDRINTAVEMISEPEQPRVDRVGHAFNHGLKRTQLSSIFSLYSLWFLICFELNSFRLTALIFWNEPWWNVVRHFFTQFHLNMQ